MWSSLSLKQKVAGVSFCIGKLHSIMAALTMMVSRTLGGLCLAVAALGVLVAVLMAAWDSREKSRRICRFSDEELRRIVEKNEQILRLVEAENK
jgi:hypothetical protein